MSSVGNRNRLKMKKSCLKSIAEEMRYQLRVKLNYHKTNGEYEMTELLFPEHYEEAVENTPARILETHHHGAGGYYRQCFYNRELDYKNMMKCSIIQLRKIRKRRRRTG